MWHEARKQERKIRGMIVDYRKRAERRQDFYEKIKADPTQFMQIHGRGCKIHLDPAVAAAGDGAAIIVPWQGQKDNLIDRFDVRAHLDYIPPPPKVNELEDISPEERHCNYERYRILAQNDFLGTSEEKFLHQLHLDEQFGANAHLEMDKMGSKKKSAAGAAISYSYDTSNDVTPFSQIHPIPVPGQAADAEAESDSDLDMDVSIDVGKLDTSQAHELNACGRNYGMMSNDFYSFLTKDADEADALKMAREEEQEKIMLSGRKSRRERRAQREKRFSGRPMSPPSYAAKEDVSNINCSMNENESDSRSPSPENSGKITFITSFGGEDELRPHSKISINLNKRGTVKTPSGLQNQVTYADKLKENLSQFDSFNEIAKKSSPPRKPMQYMRNASSSRSRSRSRSYRHRSRKRSPADRYSSRRPTYNSRRRGYSRNRSRSRSRSRTRSRSRSPKYSRNRRSSTSSSSSNSSPQRQTAANCRREVLTKPKPKDSISNIQASSSNLQKSPIMPTVICPVPEPSQPTVQVPTCEPEVVAETMEVPIKRYYGRKRDGNSSSSEELTDYEGNSGEENSNGDKSSQPSSKVHSTGILSSKSGSMAGEKQNLRDRLKRKMQILLNKQYKADKKAEIERTERQMQQQQEREDEMRELALKLRKRQREIRHKYGTPNSESSDSSQSDGSEAKNNGNAARHSSRQPQAKSRSKSRDRESRDRKIPRSSSNRNPSPSRSYSSNRSRRSRSGSRHVNNKDYAGDRRYERNYRRQDDNDRHRSPRRYAPPSRDRRERESSNYEGGRRDRRDSKSRDRDRTRDRRAYSPKRRLVDY
ncbi:unnamed protein product [Hermetia illucens]|uniref:Suppressor of white apricot N-terminal domain-containing protein n=1 Tax=Hermetia illucens TaxID=343691 RepID=A0A7R8UW03_HERIL|nr:unnamed protein product [Hermetia illucens]